MFIGLCGYGNKKESEQMKSEEIEKNKEIKEKLGTVRRHGCAICQSFKKTTLHRIP